MAATEPDPEALLVIGHGTRDARGVAEFHDLVEQLRGRCRGQAVEAAFLELVAPGIDEVLARLAGRGVRRVVAVPLLLFAAGHAKRDIPSLLAEGSAAHPGLAIRQAGALECHALLLALSQRRFDEALQRAAPHSADDTALLLVGRGSLDAEANAEMARFARLRYEQSPVAWHAVCFTAMARPSVAEGLARLARLGFGRVVVQPHLLFRGELLDRLSAQVAQARQEYAGVEWLLTDHLGPDPLLAAAVLNRAGLASGARSTGEEVGIATDP